MVIKEIEPFFQSLNEQLLLSFAEEAIQQNRLTIGLFRLWFILFLAKSILQRYLQFHDWFHATQPIRLSLIIRTLIQMTIDITNITTLVENDNSNYIFDILQSFFHILHVLILYLI